MWSENGPCYIIAEAGSNHDGSLKQAHELIRIASRAKADAVKFQCLEPLKRQWLPSLCAYAIENGLDFLATPFDLTSVKMLDELDVPAIKIASPEIVNLPLIEAAASTKRPLILSTGMATLGDIEQALHVVMPSRTSPDHAVPRHAAPSQDLVLLQCTTRYPTPYDQIDLYSMDLLRDAFNLPVGLSDHSLGTAIPIAAAALRASIIEKHFTLDRNLEGPDHNYALEPDELRAMVQGIRQAEAALGDGRKGPQEGELVEARGRSIEWTT